MNERERMKKKEIATKIEQKFQRRKSRKKEYEIKGIKKI